jgi:hypothetical protein
MNNNSYVNEVQHMLFQTATGKLLDDQELNLLTALEIEELGIHSLQAYDYAQQEN